MRIRTATSLDRDAVRAVHMSAFADSERDIVTKLAVELLPETADPRVLSLAAESDGVMVGHSAFSPVKIGSGEDLRGYILAPLGVKPEYQKRGIGSKLIGHAMQVLCASGAHLLFVYGDPAYYARFGFSAETAAPYVPPFQLQHPFGWQAIVLNEHTPPRSPVVIACVKALCDPVLW